MGHEPDVSIKKKVFRGLFWKFGERITAQMISLFVSIILARLLLPSDYGAVALVMVFINIADVFVSGGMGSALIQKKKVDNVDFSSVFYVNIMLSFLIYAVLFISAPYIAVFYDMPVLSKVLRVLGIRIPIAAINSIQQAYVSRNMLFKRFFYATLLGTLVSGFAGVFMAYRGFGVWALVMQYMINSCTDTLVLWVTVKWRPELKYSWKKAKDLISYGWKLLVSGLLDTGYNELRSLLIGRLYSPSELAFYNQGDKYPKIIVININSSIGSVLFPAISQYQDDRERVKSMTRRSIQVSSYLMWPLLFGIAVTAEPLVRLILTEKWLPCVPFLRIFCFSYGLWPVHTANLQALNAMGRSDLFLKLEVIKKILGISVLMISLHMGPLAIAWSLLMTGIMATFINSAPNRKILKYSYKEQFMDLMPSFFLSFFMALLIYPVSFMELPDLFLIFLQTVIGAVIYLAGSIITKNQSFQYLIGLVGRK